MKPSRLALLLGFAFLQVAALRTTAAVYVYDWVGGQPGFSGRILLNAPSSAEAPDGGSNADVLAGSYVATPLGVFPVFDRDLSNAFSPPGGVMSWDSSRISYMVLMFQPTSTIINPGYNLPAIGCALAGDPTFGDAVEVGSLVGGFGTAFAYDDFTGHWLAVVPEPSAASLLLLGAAALGCRRFRSRKSE